MQTTHTDAQGATPCPLSPDDIVPFAKFIRVCEQRGIATEQQLRWWARYRDVNGLIESGAMVEKRPNPTSRRPQLYVVVPRIVEWMATPSRKAGAA